MEPERLQWRVRIRDVMILVIIAALASAVGYDRWKRWQDEQRAATEMEMANAQAQAAMARAQQTINEQMEGTGEIRSGSRDAEGEAAPTASDGKRVLAKWLRRGE